MADVEDCCEVCPSKADLQTDDNVVTNIPCPIINCGRILFSKTCLAFHMRSHGVKINIERQYSKKSIFFCPFERCLYNKSDGSKSFPSWKRLRQHYQQSHQDKNLKCSKCSKKFAIDRDLRRHVSRCGLLFECKTCKVFYKTAESLAAHCRWKEHGPPILKSKENTKETPLKSSVPVPILPAAEPAQFCVMMPKMPMILPNSLKASNKVVLSPYQKPNSVYSVEKYHKFSISTGTQTTVKTRKKCFQKRKPPKGKSNETQTPFKQLLLDLNDDNPTATAAETQTVDELFSQILNNIQTQTVNIEDYFEASTQTLHSAGSAGVKSFPSSYSQTDFGNIALLDTSENLSLPVNISCETQTEQKILWQEFAGLDQGINEAANANDFSLPNEPNIENKLSSDSLLLEELSYNKSSQSPMEEGSLGCRESSLDICNSPSKHYPGLSDELISMQFDLSSSSQNSETGAGYFSVDTDLAGIKSCASQTTENRAFGILQQYESAASQTNHQVSTSIKTQTSDVSCCENVLRDSDSSLIGSALQNTMETQTWLALSESHTQTDFFDSEIDFCSSKSPTLFPDLQLE